MFDWIPWLWSFQANWGTPWGIGFAIVGGLGIVATGAILGIRENKEWEPDRFGDYPGKARYENRTFDIAAATVASSVVAGAFWPMVAIALPFLFVAGGLFVGGMFSAVSIQESLKERRGLHD